MVVNDHFIREGHAPVTTFPVTGASCHTTFNCMKSDIQTQLKKILVYSSSVQCKKVQSSIDVSLVEKITKNGKFFF